jgi:tetratricopeptide (TPR) repeat protein
MAKVKAEKSLPAMAGSFQLSNSAFPICAMHQVIEFYEQNLRLSRETGDQRGEMAALNSLGRAYAALEENAKAIECFEQGLQIARQRGDQRGEQQTLKNLDEILRPGSANDKISGKTSPPQKKRQQNSPAKKKSTRNKPSQQQIPKQPRAGKRPRQTKDS